MFYCIRLCSCSLCFAVLFSNKVGKISRAYRLLKSSLQVQITYHILITLAVFTVAVLTRYFLTVLVVSAQSSASPLSHRNYPQAIQPMYKVKTQNALCIAKDIACLYLTQALCTMQRINKNALTQTLATTEPGRRHAEEKKSKLGIRIYRPSYKYKPKTILFLHTDVMCVRALPIGHL